ncbi:MAG: extracellular solute-binding protein, partial [Chloroflexi bacterium]|nr:extracellular solute-binding protein [Chloroflexota bacterium]
MLNRKFINWILLLALLIPLALTACGGAEDIEQAVEEAAEAIEEAAPVIEEAVEEVAETVEEAVEEVVEEVTTEEPADMGYDMDLYGNIDEIDLDGAQVTFWTRYDSGGRQEAMDTICADFNATNEYGITVDCVPLGHYGILYDSMIAGLTTGDVPGLIVAYQNQAAAYQVADGLVSIEPYINHPMYGLSEEDKADFFQSFIDSDRLPQFDNQPYGFPAAGRSMEMLFYNMDWLTELGYDG